MEDAFSYVQWQSMCNNMLFTNISDKIKERHEETKRKIRHFMVEKLKPAQCLADSFQLEESIECVKGAQAPGI